MPLSQAWEWYEPEILMRRPLDPFLAPQKSNPMEKPAFDVPNFCSGETMLGPSTTEPEIGMQAETGLLYTPLLLNIDC